MTPRDGQLGLHGSAFIGAPRFELGTSSPPDSSDPRAHSRCVPPRRTAEPFLGHTLPPITAVSGGVLASPGRRGGRSEQVGRFETTELSGSTLGIASRA